MRGSCPRTDAGELSIPWSTEQVQICFTSSVLFPFKIHSGNWHCDRDTPFGDSVNQVTRTSITGYHERLQTDGEML